MALGDCLFYEILNEELTALLIVIPDLLTLCLKRFRKDRSLHTHRRAQGKDHDREIVVLQALNEKFRDNRNGVSISTASPYAQDDHLIRLLTLHQLLDFIPIVKSLNIALLKFVKFRGQWFFYDCIRKL